MLASSAYIAADLKAEASYIFDFGGTVPLDVSVATRNRASSSTPPAAAAHDADGGRPPASAAHADGGDGGGGDRAAASPSRGGAFAALRLPGAADKWLSVDAVLGTRQARRGGGFGLDRQPSTIEPSARLSSMHGDVDGGDSSSTLPPMAELAAGAPSAASPDTSHGDPGASIGSSFALPLGGLAGGGGG